MSTHEITGISTQEFRARYAKKGAVGLVAGTLRIHRAICEAQALDHAGPKAELLGPGMKNSDFTTRRQHVE